MSQNALSVITRIIPAQRPALETLLDVIGNDIDGTAANTYINFSQLTTIHFACWVVLRSAPDSDNPNNTYPDQLVFESNYDGYLEAHLDQVISLGGKALDAIYTSCEGWPSAGSKDAAAVKQYLKQHIVVTPAFYIGCPGQNLTSIRNAMDVRTEIETFLDAEDAKKPLSNLTTDQVLEKIRTFLNTPGVTRPVLSPTTLQAQIKKSWRNVWITAIVGIPILLALLPLLLIWYIVLRIHENRDNAAPIPPQLPIDPRLFGKEDYCVQNHLTTMVEVKPGKFRLGTLKVILWLINLLAKTVFTTGQLGGIPTIHFARWILMDNDRRLLFFSNYDGSWASYLGDFVDKANYGLTAVWSNTDRFPAATNLAFGGAQHIEAFKQWSRQHNVYAAVWYSAYPDETLRNLTNDILIRDQIATSALSAADLAALLQIF